MITHVDSISISMNTNEHKVLSKILWNKIYDRAARAGDAEDKVNFLNQPESTMVREFISGTEYEQLFDELKTKYLKDALTKL